MRNLFITLLTNDTLTGVEAGEDLLSWLDRLLPKFRPRRWGHYDPPKSPFDASQLKNAWKDPFIWDGFGATGGMVAMRQYPADRHGLISLCGSPGEADQAGVVEFLKTSATRFEADFGFAHVLNPAEIVSAAPGTAGFVSKGVPLLTVATQDIEEYIPDLYWATVFGPDIIDTVREQALNAPANTVEELAGGHVYVQLTESMHDAVQDFERFSEARSQARSRFAPGFFYTPH